MRKIDGIFIAACFAVVIIAIGSVERTVNNQLQEIFKVQEESYNEIRAMLDTLALVVGAEGCSISDKWDAGPDKHAYVVSCLQVVD